MTVTRSRRLPLIALGLLLPVPVLAQYQAGQTPGDAGVGGTVARAWSITPRISTAATVTDNVDLVSVGERSETVIELAPGLRAQAAGRTLTGYLDYQRREFHYVDDSSPRRGINQLNAFGRVEAVEGALSIDAAGTITEQSVSAFGLQGSGGFALNPNKAETRTVSVSPLLTGQVGTYLDYSLRFAATASRSDSSTRLGDSDNRDWSARIGGGTPVTGISWSIAGTAQRVDFADGRESEAEAVDARVFWQTSPQFRLWVSGGRESNNYLSVDSESETTRGAGFEWFPGPRTSLLASRERRFFGDSDTVSFSHRSGRSTLRFDHSRGVSSPSDDLTPGAGRGRIYDLVDAQLSSRFPDPLERAAAVDEFLNTRGIAPDTQITTGFLSARVFVQRSSTVSLLLAGRRNTITISGARTVSESLGVGLLGDDFDAFQRVEQNGINASWSLNLSPISSFSLGGSRQRTTGEGATTQRATLKTVQASFLTRLGPRTALALQLRRNESEDAPSPYVENTATLSLNYSL